jgi:hypothetical protein
MAMLRVDRRCMVIVERSITHREIRSYLLVLMSGRGRFCIEDVRISHLKGLRIEKIVFGSDRVSWRGQKVG